MKTAERARGKWRGILLAMGLDKNFLTGKHGPCPMCAGKDRFRWDNADGGGSFFCAQCGAGDGIELVKRLKGWDFKTAAKEIDALVGGVSEEKVKAKIDDKTRVEMLNRLWKSGAKLKAGDMVCNYLAKRDVMPDVAPDCLRFAPSCPVPFGGGYAPAMLAMVVGQDGTPVNIHRTFLGPNGKADLDVQRATMPGDLPAGACVRLFPPAPRLGIAEGIETALAAARRFDMPVWAALNATMLGKWLPPEGVEEVVVFGDHDPAFGGQAAAYGLAHRLAKKFKVETRIPSMVGLDWADSDAA